MLDQCHSQQTCAPFPASASIRRPVDPGRPTANALLRAVFLEAWRAGARHLWVSQVMALAVPLGVDERSVRTSLNRLEHQGVLCALRIGRQSVYGLTPATTAEAGIPFAAAEAAPWDGRWAVIAPLRRQPGLAAQLHGLGYRQMAPGLYARPGGDLTSIAGLVRAHAPSARTLVFETSRLAGLDQPELAAAVSAAWELPVIAKQYLEYIRMCERALGECAEPTRALPAPRSFALRLLLMHEWRLANDSDTHLPPALLPGTWPAGRALQLGQRLDRLLGDSAAAFVNSMVGKASANAS